MANPIDDLYDKFVNDINANPNLERQLQLTLQKLNHSVQMHFIQKHEDGYCAKFAIPDKDINSIFIGFPSLTTEDIHKSFIVGWQLPSNSHMHSNVYYHKLMLIVFYAAKNNKQTLGEYALRLILYRIWNGRILKLIKWCNPEIMAAAISVTTQRLIKKYHNPLDLIQNHFAPTIFKTYTSYMIKDSFATKRVFEQCFDRIKQIFGQDSRVDLTTGEKKYHKGIQPAYYNAHQNRNKIVKRQGDEEEGVNSNRISSLIETVVTFISVKQTKYDPKFITYVSSNIKGLKPSSIPLILSKMHQMKYVDILREIVELYFNRLRGISENDLCSTKFYDLVKTNIISSKNTQNVEYIKILCDKLLDNIFKSDMEKEYNDYMALSSNARAPYKNIIIYGIGYNIQRAVCEYK